MEVKEIQTKSILTLSKLPDTDYVINPYVGCRFGCTYCYASFMGRFVSKQINDWGEYVYAKINAPELLRNELRKLKNKGRNKSCPGGKENTTTKHTNFVTKLHEYMH